MGVVPFVAHVQLFLPPDAMFRAERGGCPYCGDYFPKPTKLDEFWADAGQGCSWYVNNKIGLCPKCYKELKKRLLSAPKSRELKPLKVAYSYNQYDRNVPYSEEVIAYEDAL